MRDHKSYIECPHGYVLQLILHEFLIIIICDSWGWCVHSFLSKPLAKQMSQYTLFSAICKPFEPNIDFFHKPGLGRSFQPYPGIRKKGYLPRGISIIFWLVMFIKTKKAKKKIYKEQKPQRKKKRKEKKRKRKENNNII